MNLKVMLFASIFAVMAFSLTTSFAFAHPHPSQVMINSHTHEPQTEIIPLDGMIGLEKSIISFYAPEDNTLPWGFVEGNVANHVEGYPVIIQIFKDNDTVHFAQANVEKDGDYEYKFRVLSLDSDSTTKIFDGYYSVKIFKVVYLTHENLA